jgi:hypothetical protein
VGRQPSKDNNLAVRYPDIAKEWHPNANDPFKPLDFFPFSGKKAWWICPEGHSYESQISNRTARNSGCPYCSGLKVTKDKDFATLHPEKAREWDYEKNKGFLPEKFSEFSGKKVWWKCKKNHEWQTAIATRSQGSNCPFCWKHTSVPEFRLLAEFELLFGNVARRRKFSGLEVDLYLEKYQIGVEYDGSYWHKGKETRDRKKGVALSEQGIKLLRVREEPLEILSEFDVLTSSRGLKKEVVDEILTNIKPYCDDDDLLKIDQYISLKTFQNEKVFKKYLTDLPEPDLENSLANEEETLLSEFDYEKNTPLEPKNFSRGTQYKVWWKCKKGHSWKTTVNTRTSNKSGCPFCSRNFASSEINLELMYPAVAAQWHPTKNGKTYPLKVSPKSSLKRWWLCKEGHEWEVAVSTRTANESACPYCAGSFASSSNNLATVFPNLLEVWHPTKNKGLNPESLLPSSGKKVWLLCREEHEWQAVPNNIQSILKGDVEKICPTCRRLANSLKQKFPDLLKEWDFEKNTGVEPNTVSYGSKSKYWWQCENGHHWEASPNQRTRPASTGCPLCNNRAPYADIPVTEENCLLTTDRELCNDWDYALNIKASPETIRRVCKDKVWWKCAAGHSWEAIIGVRALKKTGCPICARKVRAHTRRENSS